MNYNYVLKEVVLCLPNSLISIDTPQLIMQLKIALTIVAAILTTIAAIIGLVAALI